ncbi:MAG TPA: GNAT family N-acetyltransferase [Cyanobacteria bacterium UBA8553]|nr:GNAT family N-acetyltransferase [Cyanobacteria bacterium UBA8553]HAJ59700.1 GNAT family N-acetyltransferase [Cyanobacteria bacterium UBA8543]
MSNIEVRPIQNQTELDEMYYQRWLVLRAPLGMARGTEKDKYDDSAFHLVAVYNHRVIGSARLRELSKELGSIAYVSVLPEFCNQGIGTKLIEKLIETAMEKNLKSLRLMSRITALRFYQRLGFLSIGEPFDFLDIPHKFMSLEITNLL